MPPNARRGAALAAGKTALRQWVLPHVDLTVTVLSFDGCPNVRAADERVREALARAGRDDVHVVHRLVATAEEAEAVGFRGSPTVLINGRDPFADPEAAAGLSCRVYGTEAGPAGAPTVEQLLAALQ